MNAKHTPEPWIARKVQDKATPTIPAFFREICGADGETVSFENVRVGAQETQRDYDNARIVACVNVCKGIPQETLEAAPLGHAAEWFSVWNLVAHMADPAATLKAAREAHEEAKYALRVRSHFTSDSEEYKILTRIDDTARRVLALLRGAR